MSKIIHIVGVRWWSALAAYAVNLAEAQEEQGHNVWLAAERGSPAEREARRRGLQALYSFSGGLGGMWQLTRRLGKFLMTEEPDAETQAMIDELRIPKGDTVLASTH